MIPFNILKFFGEHLASFLLKCLRPNYDAIVARPVKESVEAEAIKNTREFSPFWYSIFSYIFSHRATLLHQEKF